MLMSFLFSLILFSAVLLFQALHPILLAYALLLYSLSLSLLLAKLTSSWLMYGLILVFMGGVMVLIIYMTSLAANEKLMSPLSFSPFPPLILGGGLGTYLCLPTTPLTFAPGPGSSLVAPLLKSGMSPLFLLVLLYLLVVLVSTVKIVDLKSGPLACRA